MSSRYLAGIIFGAMVGMFELWDMEAQLDELREENKHNKREAKRWQTVAANVSRRRNLNGVLIHAIDESGLNHEEYDGRISESSCGGGDCRVPCNTPDVRVGADCEDADQLSEERDDRDGNIVCRCDHCRKGLGDWCVTVGSCGSINTTDNCGTSTHSSV